MTEKGKKPNTAEAQRRQFEVYELLLSGADRPTVIQYATEKWGIGERQTDEYIRKANVEIDKKFEVDTVKLKNLSIKRRRHLYFKAMRAGNLALAHEIQRDFDRLTGQYPAEEHKHKVGGDPDNPTPIQSQQIVYHSILNRNPIAQAKAKESKS